MAKIHAWAHTHTNTLRAGERLHYGNNDSSVSARLYAESGPLSILPRMAACSHNDESKQHVFLERHRG